MPFDVRLFVCKNKLPKYYKQIHYRLNRPVESTFQEKRVCTFQVWVGSLVAIRITQKSYFFLSCLRLVRKYCKLALCCSNRPPGLGNQGCLFYPCLIPEVLDWSSAAISLCQKLANFVQKLFVRKTKLCEFWIFHFETIILF